MSLKTRIKKLEGCRENEDVGQVEQPATAWLKMQIGSLQLPETPESKIARASSTSEWLRQIIKEINEKSA